MIFVLFIFRVFLSTTLLKSLEIAVDTGWWILVGTSEEDRA